MKYECPRACIHGGVAKTKLRIFRSDAKSRIFTKNSVTGGIEITTPPLKGGQPAYNADFGDVDMAENFHEPYLHAELELAAHILGFRSTIGT